MPGILIGKAMDDREPDDAGRFARITRVSPIARGFDCADARASFYWDLGRFAGRQSSRRLRGGPCEPDADVRRVLGDGWGRGWGSYHRDKT